VLVVHELGGSHVHRSGGDVRPAMVNSGKASHPLSPVVHDQFNIFRDALTDGRRFSHVERLREDPTIPEIFGMESVVSDDTVRRFFKSIDPAVGAEWVARHARPMWRALPEQIILDWDSTVQPKYGHQEGAEVGYNPIKPGRRSFHPLLVLGDRCPAGPVRASEGTPCEYKRKLGQTIT
jgi:hypothetical protein